MASLLHPEPPSAHDGQPSVDRYPWLISLWGVGALAGAVGYAVRLGWLPLAFVGFVALIVAAGDVHYHAKQALIARDNKIRQLESEVDWWKRKAAA